MSLATSYSVIPIPLTLHYLFHYVMKIGFGSGIQTKNGVFVWYSAHLALSLPPSMKILGNIIWLVFGGIEIAIEYVIGSLAMMITIIGIPFGLQSLKLGILALWPFGSRVVKKPTSGCLNTLMNIIWFFVGGVWIWLTHIFFGLLLCITIIGIPFGKQHFKLADIALTPFGREIVDA